MISDKSTGLVLYVVGGLQVVGSGIGLVASIVAQPHDPNAPPATQTQTAPGGTASTAPGAPAGAGAVMQPSTISPTGRIITGVLFGLGIVVGAIVIHGGAVLRQ